MTRVKVAMPGGSFKGGVFSASLLHPRHKQEQNPDPPLQTPGHNPGIEDSPPRLAGKGIRFARADNPA